MMNALIIWSTTAGTFKAEHVVWGFELSEPQIYNTIILLLIASSVVASFICQEGQSAKTIPNFSWFSPSFFPIFGKCFTVNRGTLPPLTPSGYATANCTWIGIYSNVYFYCSIILLSLLFCYHTLTCNCLMKAMCSLKSALKMGAHQISYFAACLYFGPDMPL